MTSNLGVVGIGHWFFRLHEGMSKTNEIRLLKVASASSIDKHKEQLAKLGVPQSSYYEIGKEQLINDDFFKDLDIVHIADPNEFHKTQTIQALQNGKITITEKTLGINRQEFDEILTYVTENNLQSRVYLHLHYAHKLLTLQLPELLKRLTKEYGKITSTSATFFESELADVKRRRLWLFQPKNGGLFMDWIHPFEVYYKGALADQMEFIDADQYVVNPEYDTLNPTGIHSRIKIGGIFFAKGAEANIRISIGIKGQKNEAKGIRFVFEQGQCLDLNFVSSEVEFNTDYRGSWTLREKDGGKIIESVQPKGPTASDILVNDILELCRRRNPGFTPKDLSIIYGPQWEYQEIARQKPLITDPESVRKFINEGMNIPQNQKVLG
ncbi:MAG: Gfo/Idh/MocA family oxidoreductase [Candidatus Micrarchaeota archaeon]|nr:Gfo/Idh/MocA family oxidoreductase [Candidatus Micrarchaeota archaeon]